MAIPENSLYIEIGKRIYRSRKTAGITQKDLANQIGLTRTSIVHIEKGEQKIPIDKLYKIAHILAVDLFYLLPKFNPKTTENLISMIDPASKKRLNVDKQRDVIKTISSILQKEEGDNGS